MLVKSLVRFILQNLMVRVRKNNMGWLKILFWLPQAQCIWSDFLGKIAADHTTGLLKKTHNYVFPKTAVNIPLISVKKYPSKQKLLDLTLQNPVSPQKELEISPGLLKNTPFCLHKNSWKDP